MIDVVVKHNGILDKFMGDGLLAVFGAPISYGNDALNAVMAAIEMIDRLEGFNQQLMNERDLEFVIGIGIHSGQVVAGNIGSDLHIEYTVIGDTVNTTNRIEGLTKELKNAILISETTFELVQDFFESTYLGPIELRGKKKDMKVYQILGIKKDRILSRNISR